MSAAPRPSIPNELLLRIQSPGGHRVAAYVAEFGTSATRLKAYHIEVALGLNRRTVANALAELTQLGAVRPSDTGSGLSKYFLPGPALLCAAYTKSDNPDSVFEHGIHNPLSDFERAVHKSDGADCVSDAQSGNGTRDATRTPVSNRLLLEERKPLDTRQAASQRARAHEAVDAAARSIAVGRVLGVYCDLTKRSVHSRDQAAAGQIVDLGLDLDFVSGAMREMHATATAPVRSLAYFVDGIRDRARRRAQSSVGAEPEPAVESTRPTPTDDEIVASAAAKPEGYYHAQRLRAYAAEFLGRRPDVEIPELANWLDEQRAELRIPMPRDGVDEIAAEMWMRANAPPPAAPEPISAPTRRTPPAASKAG